MTRLLGHCDAYQFESACWLINNCECKEVLKLQSQARREIDRHAKRNWCDGPAKAGANADRLPLLIEVNCVRWVNNELGGSRWRRPGLGKARSSKVKQGMGKDGMRRIDDYVDGGCTRRRRWEGTGFCLAEEDQQVKSSQVETAESAFAHLPPVEVKP